MTNNHTWHTLSSADVSAMLEVDPARGLTATEAQARLTQHGPNRLTETRPRAAWLKFLDQFRNILVIVLLFATALAWVIGDIKDAVVILIVVLFNACLGFYQEYRAEQTLAALKGMLATRARVRRDGQIGEIDAAELVPGDIVLIEAGDRIPADGRLLAAHNLEVDEAALTGESHAVGKSVEAMEQTDLPLGDRVNLLYMNTVVTRGRAELLITATGMATEMGILAGMIAAAEESESPLQRQLDTLGKRLAAIAGVVVSVIFALDFARGLPWTEAAMTAVALAVAAIPEGLPAVVTVTLAIGMWRMAQNRAILKKLSAVETLGSTTVICTDKTGTLTMNQMTARAGWYAGQRFVVSGEGYRADGDIRFARQTPDLRPLLLPMALCVDSRVRDAQLIGNPTEGALWVLAQKGGIDPEREQERQPRIAEIPFDSSHKFMATFHHAGATVEMFIKGAPDVLIERTSRWLAQDGERPLDASARATLLAENEHLAGQALRVLAVARRVIPAADFDPASDLWAYAEDWTFLGLAGLMDPPRPEAMTAIARCGHAGIAVKMITGDHKATATAIGRELGLSGEVVEGRELDAHECGGTVATHRCHRRLRPRVTGTQGQDRAGAEGRWPCGGDDRRWRQRCAGTEGRRHRRGHGHHRHRSDQGGRNTGAHRRQLRHHRARGRGRPRDLRQHRQVRALPAIDQHRRHPHRAGSDAHGHAGTIYRNSTPLDQHHHGRSARHVAWASNRHAPA